MAQADILAELGGLIARLVILRVLGVLALTALADVLVKEFFVKRYLLSQYRNWILLPDFWKDKIDVESIWRFRWAYLVNLGGLAGAWICCGWIGAALYLYLAAINTEHILYQWLCGCLVPGRKLLDLTDAPVWMDGLPWNRALARYHGRAHTGSEEILTIFVIGWAALIALI